MPAAIQLSDLPAPAVGRSGWPWTAAPAADLSAALPEGVSWPRITIVTPSYNQGQFLEATIRSVLLQAYPNLEYLVLDGGSTDDSVAIIRRYEPWLNDWVSAPDGGQSRAINQGFARATGQVLAWLNSDDTYEPGALVRVGRAFADPPEAVLIFGQAYHISRAGRRIGQASARPYDRRWLLEQGNSIPQPSAFFSRAGWRAVGQLDETLHFAMDYDLWFRLGDYGPARFLPEFLSNQRIYSEAKTSAGDHRHYREVQQVVQRHGGSGLPAGFANWLVDTHLPKAWEAYRSGDVVTGQMELSYVLENVPAMRVEDRLSQEIARYAWALSVGLAGQDSAALAFAESVCQHLPSAVTQPGRLRRRVLAALHKASAHRHFARGERAEVWRRVGQTLVHAPGYARDRGLWAMGVRALLRPASAGDRPVHIEPARQRVLAWLETLRGERPAGQYGTRADASTATLEGSALAAQVRGLWGAPARPSDETAGWAQYLLTQQAVPENEPSKQHAANTPRQAGSTRRELDEWQRAVLTATALHSLGVTYQAPLRFVERFLESEALDAWLAGLDWAQPREAGQQVRLLAVGLAQEHARTGAAVYWQALEAIGNWLAARVTTETGAWTFGEPIAHLESLYNVCNLAPLFILLGHLLPAVEPLITFILNLQQFSGLFGLGATDEAWADLAAVEVLARVSQCNDFRAAEVRLAMGLSLRAILRRQQPDGGFATDSGPAVSELRPTWLRSLTVAVIGARWPELLADPIRSQCPPLPELGGGHAPNVTAAPLLTNSQ